jgi:hypothetical protein
MVPQSVEENLVRLLIRDFIDAVAHYRRSDSSKRKTKSARDYSFYEKAKKAET